MSSSNGARARPPSPAAQNDEIDEGSQLFISLYTEFSKWMRARSALGARRDPGREAGEAVLREFRGHLAQSSRGVFEDAEREFGDLGYEIALLKWLEDDDD